MKKTAILLLFVFLLTLTACEKGPEEVTDFAFTATVCGEEFSGTFTGTILENVPNGAGTFTFDNGKKSLTYSGQWENGVIVGTGQLEYDGYELEYNDTEYTGIYEGEAENGLPSGEGTFEGEKRDKYLVYEGTWKDGVFAGEGYLEANEFKVDVGDGVIKYGDFEGNVVDGVASGSGQYTAENKDGVMYTYTGDWENGQFNGEGTLKYKRENAYAITGNYTNGNFTPTPDQFFITLGTPENANFYVVENAIQFLKNNPDIFLNNTLDSTGIEANKHFKFSEFSKNPENYGDSLITVNMSVIQIWEKFLDDIPYTYCLGQDGNRNYYFMFMYNTAENIYEGSWVKATILPLDYFNYTTVSGTKNWAMAAAAVSITK